MLIHRMELQTQFFNYIKTGTKRIECRLYDEKRQKIQLGDVIEFHNPKDEIVAVKVLGLLRYKTFKEMFEDYDISLLADKSITKEQLIKALEKYYDADKQAKFGVIGFRFEILKNYPDVIDTPKRLL